MPKITYKIPHATLGIIDATGTVMWMQVGPQRVKFVLQDDGGHLVHWASGMIAVMGTRIKDTQLRSYVANPYGVGLSDRAAASQVMAQFDPGKVLGKIDLAEVINK